MNKVIRLLVGLFAVVFVFIGIRWIVDPAGAAGELGMPLLEGVGRSTQLGDSTAFFLTVGICMLVALITEKRTWFYPPIMLLSITAVARILAWLLHDATLAVNFIVLELLVAGLLWLASRRLAGQNQA
ncbi:MAG: hypothetical protein HKO71_04195 [Pseudomonadales bacterium]|nr:hypothetical protein [Gammaproteobacteria bacterium]NNL56927.1 hypothetical protein [Pseudomonadales bacterium]